MTAHSDPVVIIGGGLAGAKTAENLRQQGYDGPVTLIGREAHPPYERPALSKEYLAGSQGRSDIAVHDRRWYDDNGIELRLGTDATAIDTAARRVTLAGGAVVGYSSLVLATGSRPVRPPIDGADARGVHVLRTVDDADALVSSLRDGAHLAVIGGGWIGLEVASVARGRGADVTVIEAGKQPLASALGEELGAQFAGLHREHGVDVRLESRVEAISTDADSAATGVRLADGRTIKADAVLLAVGARAEINLAEDAGLATGDGGVRVDAGMRTSAPDVYAVGDIAAAEHPLLGVRVRTEHWANALKQPAVAAANICGGDEQYTDLPYFFTDQYDLGMEFSGRTAGYTQVVYRGDVIGREFLAFWTDEAGRVLAGMNVNIWDRTEDIKALVSARARVDRDALADPGVDLRALAG